MAMACFRLFTLLPETPALSVRYFILWTARSTVCEALGPYFLMRDLLVGIDCFLLGRNPCAINCDRGKPESGDRLRTDRAQSEESRRLENA
jgi:hypothetical protein